MRRGEYEHTLKVLAACLVGELKQEAPEPGDFSQMARRLEVLSKTDLKVLTLIDVSIEEKEGTGKRPFVSATSLANERQAKRWGLEKIDIENL